VSDDPGPRSGPIQITAGIDASGKLVGLNVGYSFAFAEYTVLSALKNGGITMG
jgi:hypothetical protein